MCYKADSKYHVFSTFWQSNLQYSENKDTSLGRCLKINQNYFLLTRKYFKICKYILHLSGLNTYLNSQKPNEPPFGSVIFQGMLGYAPLFALFLKTHKKKSPPHRSRDFLFVDFLNLNLQKLAKGFVSKQGVKTINR